MTGAATQIRQPARVRRKARIAPDPWLAGMAFVLLVLGVVMVASASMPLAARRTGDPFFYAQHQAIFALIALAGAVVVYEIPMAFWERSRFMVLMAAFFLLALVLIPGLGHGVNGSMRWFQFGPVTGQPSELARLFVFLYLAGYLVHRRDNIERLGGVVRPMAVVVFAGGLLLLEPDFGTAAIMMVVAIGMLMLGGLKLRYLLLLMLVAGVTFALLIWSSPYRMDRLTGFINPWADPLDDGFQLIQSLIAVGRGGWFGVGLGESVQKLFYLPESYTDFLFAVLTEELGVLGALTVIMLYLGVTWRAFVIGRRATRCGYDYGAFVAYGLGLWVGIQAFINIGVNLGVLPTKGLTLPLMSYGGSSLIVTVVSIALILRVQREVTASARPAREVRR